MATKSFGHRIFTSLIFCYGILTVVSYFSLANKLQQFKIPKQGCHFFNLKSIDGYYKVC